MTVKLTNEEVHSLLFNAKKKFMDLKVPKIKRYNPLMKAYKGDVKICPSWGSSYEIDVDPNFTDEDLSLYKKLVDKRENDNSPKSVREKLLAKTTFGWIVDPDRTVRWNFTGNKLVEEEKIKHNQAEANAFFDDLKKNGYNNKEKINKFRNEIETTFESLIDLLYPDVVNRKEIFYFSENKYLGSHDYLSSYLGDVLTTSSLNHYYEPYSSALMYRFYKSIIFDFIGSTDTGLKHRMYHPEK